MYQPIPTIREKRLAVLLLASLGLLIISLIFILRSHNTSTSTSPDSVSAVPLTLSTPVLQQLTQAKPVESSPLPVRLKIPAIGVNASLDYVGLTSSGAMGVPSSPSTAAWFNLGPRPGEIGSAVIDGHFGTWKNGQTSVFDNLYKLRKGNILTVEDSSGAVITFVVTELRIYDQSQDASDVFSSSDGKAHLNLITCEGTWNVAKQSFPSRLVVFTDRK
jgi:LPXTG-site transpeptidase (sortase) family protein